MMVIGRRLPWVGLRTWRDGDLEYFRSERCFSKWMRTYAETKLASLLCCTRLVERYSSSLSLSRASRLICEHGLSLSLSLSLFAA